MIFKSFDGKELYVHEWLNVERPRGIVQIIHGMAEHGGRYGAFAEFLNERGFLVAADDHRGHGRTDSETLGYCPGDMFADVVRDEAALTDYYKEKYPGLPLFLFGFSFGSFLTQSYISRYGGKIDGAVIGGSCHKKDLEVYFGSLVAGLSGERRPGKLLAMASFGAYAKKFPDGQWLSTDAENNAAYDADPFCGFTCSNRFYRDFFRGLRGLYTKSYIAGLRKDLPVLLVSGADDPVGNMGAGVWKLHAFYTEKAGMKDVSIVLFKNSRHEFLNEKQGRAGKWDAVLGFFEKDL